MSFFVARIVPNTTFGMLVRWLSGNKLFQFPEEKPWFQLSPEYASAASSQGPIFSPELHPGNVNKDGRHAVFYSDTLNSRPKELRPEITADGTILVGWYDLHDHDDPHCWPSWVKFIVYLQINFYTFIIYMASSIFSVAQREFIDIYDVPTVVGSLGLALVLLGYGLGALLLSPLSEIPAIGRNPPYVISLAIVILVSGLTVTVDNVPGFLVLRFLQGFFGSPGLATGAASLTDITSIVNTPYGIWIWGTCAVAAPAIAPCMAGFSIMANGWRWSMWEIFWGATSCMVLLLFLPETFVPTILHKRAARLRVLTGNNDFKAFSEIDHSIYPITSLVHGALIMPWKINILDPAILFTTIYTALVYAIFYSFFEVFPFVYQEIYHMDIAHMGLVFLAAIIAVIIIMPFYFLFIHYAINRPIRNGQFVPPERRLGPALFGSVLIPMGMYIFAWTSRGDIHWTVPTVGFMLIMAGVITLMQCMFGYIAVAYPRHSASLFAMNDFARSTVAFAAILWSGPLYRNLGVARGTSLVGALTVVCIFGIFGLYWFGLKLRKRSRFAE